MPLIKESATGGISGPNQIDSTSMFDTFEHSETFCTYDSKHNFNRDESLFNILTVVQNRLLQAVFTE